MATSKIQVSEGSGKNIASYSFSEDAVTKDVQRATLSNSSGTEIGTSSNPVQVSLANTAANSTAVKVDGSAVTQPVSIASTVTVLTAAPATPVKGTTSAITDTTSTQVIAANATKATYITDIIVTNSHATVGTFVKILDGSTIVWEGYAAAVGGGFVTSLRTPLVGTSNTAVNAQCVTTGSNVIVSVSGYQI
jgi:hypothetical protein